MRPRLPLPAMLLALLLAFSGAARSDGAARTARVGLLSDRNPHGTEAALLRSFREALRESGWAEGRNLTLVARYSGEDAARLPALAAQIVGESPDVIFATTLPAALAAKQATATIPIVFNVLPDPVEHGLVATLARPGANITGLAINSSALIPKRLQLLKEAVPRLSRVAVLLDPRQDESCEAAWEALREPAQALGVSLERVSVASGYAHAFDSIARARLQAVMVPATTRFYNDAALIAAHASRRRIIPILSVGDVAEEHILMAFGPLQAEAYRRAALFVDRILRGAQPGTLAVEQPTRYELVLNLRVARELGIAFPRDLRARADRLIE